MSDEKVEVKSLVIRIGGEERKVSIEDARRLWLALDGFFGPKTPLYGPTTPVIVERERWPEYPKPTPVWCGGGTDRPLPDPCVSVCCCASGV